MKTFTILVLLGFASIAHAQVAQNPRVNANSCDPTTPSVTTWGRGLLGFYNASTTLSIGATCVVPIEGTSLTTGTLMGPTTVRVYYNDNHSGSGSAVFCSAYIETVDSGGFFVGTKYSCSTPGGCTTSSNTFLGPGYLEFSTPYQATNVSDVLLLCSIPPIQSGWGASSLTRIAASLIVE